MDNKIKILTSAMGLGTYIPALHISDYLQRNDYFVNLEVFEEFFDEATLDKYAKTKSMFQSSYKAAVLGHKLASKKLNFILGDTITDRIIEKWKDEDIDTFIILSGNWTSIVSRYMEIHEHVKAIIVHMDVGVAPSFMDFHNQNNRFIEIWPIDEKGVNYIIDNHFDEIRTMSSEEKQNKLFLHGGGWGMGTYRNKLEELSTILPNSMITSINNKNEYKPHNNIEYYMIDPSWKPWLKYNNAPCDYPPMSKVDKDIEIINNKHSNGLYQLYHTCCGIISKPGGGTLMDSLITTTPIIFLEPIADHEKVNEKVWIELGYGISYEAWIQSVDPIKVLMDMKENLKMCKSRTQSLGSRLIKEVCK